ncbi:hypothetical protein DH2020_013032 [Rehmannia glutinosa]|uniref:Pectinesterase inhibitor domain-containing protein n=1 Tax=Rehmannia glutinosa TaxID=99300 RepID=A0ABR0X299_REHGL
MDSSNPTSKASLLRRDDDVSSVRRRNKTLIIIFFSLIFLLALIIGGIIIFLVSKHNSQSQSLEENPAIREFCSSSYTFSCITSLSTAIRIPSNTNPNQIFMLSLETSRIKLSNIILSMASNETRPEAALRNCSGSLGHAMGQLGNILELIRVNPDLETRTYEQRGDMTAWIDAAAEDLASCVGDLGKVESTAVDGLMGKVVEVGDLVGYGKEFVVNIDSVNQNFRWALAQDESSRNRIVDNLAAVSFFGSQYFVLVLLFCLLVRIY